jgi:hypothetical protein
MRNCQHDNVRTIQIETSQVMVCANCCESLMVIVCPRLTDKNALREAAEKIAFSEKYKEAPKEKRKYNSKGFKKIYP